MVAQKQGPVDLKCDAEVISYWLAKWLNYRDRYTSLVMSPVSYEIKMDTMLSMLPKRITFKRVSISLVKHD